MENSPSQRPIDQLFNALHIRYGSAWLKKWEGIALEHVKQDWMRCLSGFAAGAVKHALANLPDTPPNAEQFRRLCRQYVEYRPAHTLTWKPQQLPEAQRSEVVDFLEQQARRVHRQPSIRPNGFLKGGSSGDAA